MARRIATGIDIGTNQVKVVVTECVRGKDGIVPRVIGTGIAESKGLRHGYILVPGDAARCVLEAKRQAEAAAGVAIKNAFLAVGGVGLDEHRATGEVVISRSDDAIGELDVEKALEVARESAKTALANRTVLTAVETAYRVDGQQVLGKPFGLRGTRLEIDVLFVTALRTHVEDLVAAVEEAGIAVIDTFPSPLAGSFVTLTRAQRLQGCVLANVGAETVSVVVYDRDIPISVKVFDAGAGDVTNALALEFRISPEDAEKLKRGRLSGSSYSQTKIASVVAARVKAMFSLVEAHLRTIGKSGTLPAGVVISGGGAGIGPIEDIARAVLKLHAKTAEIAGGDKAVMKDSTWAVAYGLTIWALREEDDMSHAKAMKKAGGMLGNFFKQFLP